MNNFKFRNLEFKCSAFFIDLIRYLFMIEKSAMAVDMLFRKRKTVFHLRLTHLHCFPHRFKLSQKCLPVLRYSKMEHKTGPQFFRYIGTGNRWDRDMVL